MAEFGLPRSDEPFDFRRQAGTYGRFRRDYSDALYAAIAQAVGAGAGRRALDLGCGTGFVTASLAARGWQAMGADFSAPMLAEAVATGLPLMQMRAEALALRDGSVALVTSGTAFHWFSAGPALTEIARVLVPGGWVALFWRYPHPDARTIGLAIECLRAVNPDVPEALRGFRVHGPAPFDGTALRPTPPLRFDATLRWTAETFLGYAGTVEWFRRVAGDRHAEFLDRLGAALAREWSSEFEEPNQEYLFLAQRPLA